MKYQKGQKVLSAITLSATLLMTSGNVLADEPVNNADPYEAFNRPMFAFNDTLDKYVLKPVATFYNTIMPTPLNQGIHNVFLNFGNLPNIANDLLQFHFYQAANDSWRLVINTTIGVGGLFDIAGRMNLKPYVNDFGMTLATWGFKQSNYLVLPVFGSHTVRDTIGMPVDYYGFSIYPYITPDRTQYAVYGLGVIDNRAQLLKYQDVMEAAAVDRYAFIRNAYIQKRTFQIEENKHRGYADQLNNTANSTVTATAGDSPDYTATPSE